MNIIEDRKIQHRHAALQCGLVSCLRLAELRQRLRQVRVGSTGNLRRHREPLLGREIARRFQLGLHRAIRRHRVEEIVLILGNRRRIG